MAIKKPSDYFKEKECELSNAVSVLSSEDLQSQSFSETLHSFKKNLNRIQSISKFSEELDNYQGNLKKIQEISEKVDSIQNEIKNYITREDLDNSVLCQLFAIEESISRYQNEIVDVNKQNLKNIKKESSNIVNLVNSFLEVDVPKYKKIIIDSEFRFDVRCKNIETNIENILENIQTIIESKYNEFEKNVIKKNQLESNEVLKELNFLKASILEFKNFDIPKYKKILVETELKTDNRLDEFSIKLNETLSDISDKMEKVGSLNGESLNNINSAISEINLVHESTIDNIKLNNQYRQEMSKKVAELEVDILRNRNHIKNQNINLQNVQENVKSQINRLNLDTLEKKNYELGKKVKYLEEVFEKFNEKEILTEELVSESVVTEPPSTDNKDPLTPLNQNFVTLDQLQSHYRLFINRIQQQLSTLGGGGETRFEFLDDVDRNSVKQDGYFLKYDSSVQKIVGSAIAPGGGGESYWAENQTGIHTTSNIGVGTDISSSLITLEDVLGIDVVTVSVATTSPTLVYSFPSTSYRSSKLQAQITQGTEYQTSELLILHNGSNSDITEMSTLVSNNYLGSFLVEVVGLNVNVNVVMESPNSADIKLVSYKITI